MYLGLALGETLAYPFSSQTEVSHRGPAHIWAMTSDGAIFCACGI